MNITLTGADERTPIRDLIALADMGAEIGILYTHDPEGRHRYPSFEWIVNAVTSLRGRAAIHVCGGRARSIFSQGGLDDLVLSHVRRIQVNGGVLPNELASLCRLYPEHTIITQHTGCNAPLVDVPAYNHALLIDGSGGRGILPGEWQRPETSKPVGFAGGLGPDTLRSQLPKIEAVATADAWVDMEGGLREDDWFSVNRAVRCIEIFGKHKFSTEQQRWQSTT
jgi:hypothetical protein